MINQKGQAFSVFELMIAGVVAFAILMVLMQVIGGVLTGQDTDALSAISDAVKSANPSGEQPVANFVLKKGVSVDQSDLALATDLDADSFIFVLGAYGVDSGTNEIETDGTYLKYIGSQQKKKLAAIVVCKPTAAQVGSAVGRITAATATSTYDFTTLSTEDGCVSDATTKCCPEGLVCCVIIPTKPTS